MSTVLVAIPVHERAVLVRYCFATAAELVMPEGSRIVVYDDASPTLDVAALMAETGLRAGFERSVVRRGASGAITRIWQAFLDSDHDYLLFLDSDMIINRDAIAAGLDRMAHFDGLLTLYNSVLHAGEADGPDLVRKRRVGNAGTFWRRSIVQSALKGVGGQAYIDDRYCEFFNARNVPIAATLRSRVQHLGISGENYHPYGALDHGSGFIPDASAQSMAIAFAHDHLLSHQEVFLPGTSWLRARRKSTFWERLTKRRGKPKA